MERIRRLLDTKLSAACDDESPGVAVLVERSGSERLHLTKGCADVANGTSISIHTCFDAGSIAKTVTGLCIGLLVDEGKLSLSASVRAFLPGLPDATSCVSIEHLLRHESGLHDYSTLLYYMAGWHPQAAPTSQEILEVLSRAPGPKWEPGSRYEYADTNYFLLARVIERVTGEPFGTVARLRVFEPLGMSDSYMTDVAPPKDAETAEGYAAYPIELRSPYEFRQTWKESFYPVRHRYRHTGAEGFRTSVADLATLGRELLEPMTIDPSTMARITTPTRVREDGLGYGYGLNAGMLDGLEFLGHDGMIQGFTASLSIFPEHRLAIACLTNREDIGAWMCRNAVLRDVLGAETTEEIDRLCVSGSARELRPGFYLCPETSGSLEVMVDRGTSRARVNGGEIQPIVFTGSVPGDRSASGGAIEVDCHGDKQSFASFDAQPVRCFDEYAGVYRSEELQTAFTVEGIGTGIRLTNADSARPSMDLEYAPTIHDFFWSHDPYPDISQLEFLRTDGRVAAFRYRDYDGDGREVFVFRRI